MKKKKIYLSVFTLLTLFVLNFTVHVNASNLEHADVPSCYSHVAVEDVCQDDVILRSPLYVAQCVKCGKTFQGKNKNSVKQAAIAHYNSYPPSEGHRYVWISD